MIEMAGATQRSNSSRGRRVTQPISVTINSLAALVLLFVTAVLLLRPRDSEFLFTPWRGRLFTFLALVGGWLLIRWVRRRPAPSRRVTILWGLALTGASGIVTYFSQFAYGWDPRAIRIATYQLARSGHLDTGLLEYFARYPNNLPLALIETPLTRLALATGISFSNVLLVWNCALFFGVLMFAAATLRCLGRQSWIIPILVLLTLLLGFSPHMVMPYSDLPGCFLSSAFIYIGTRIHADRQRAYMWVCVAAFLVGITYLIKPYVLVIPIAGAIMLILSGALSNAAHKWGAWGAVWRLALVPMLILVASMGERGLAYRNADVTPAQLETYNAPFPILHWVAMGLHDNGSRQPQRSYGSFDMGIMRRDVHIKDATTRNEVIRQGIEKDIERQGIGGTGVFMAKKIAWVLGDGSFFAQKDGADAKAQPTHPGVIAEFTLRDGRYYHFKAGLTQAVWGAVLLAIAFGLVRARRRPAVAWLSLAFLGFVTYESVFEGRPRYVVAVLPLIVMLLAWTATRDDDQGPKAPVESA